MTAQRARTDLQWLLDDLVARVDGVERVVLLSSDGLLIARSAAVVEEDAEHLSAVASAFHSLARSAARQFSGGRVQQTVVEMDNSFLFVTAAGPGACLTVLANASADIGAVAYEMGLLVRRVGPALSTAPRVPGTRDPLSQ
ncbi:dynein regulation protein LC7 [Pseudonocardia sp. CNS-139]|nr:dynein regulation protein LC7 [Pseudonocardia sp. CNS-139]